MATRKDWIAEVVEEIESSASEPRPNGDYTPGYVRGVIRKYSPFQEDVLYMPVPRCDQCRFWDKHEEYTRAVCVHPTPKRARCPGEWDRAAWIWHDPDDGCVQFEAKDK